MRLRWIGTLAMVSALGSGAQASDGVTCAKLEDAGERLLCYDGVFRTETKSGPTSEASKWEFSTQKSKIDDSTSVHLQVHSDEEIPGKYQRPVSATFWLRCHEQTTSVILMLGDHFLADTGGFGDVTFRVDENKAFTQSMNSSTDHSALGLWRGGQAIPFIKKILTGKRLTVRATPYSESPLTATFAIAGLEAAITPLRTTCKW